MSRSSNTTLLFAVAGAVILNEMMKGSEQPINQCSRRTLPRSKAIPRRDTSMDAIIASLPSEEEISAEFDPTVSRTRAWVEFILSFIVFFCGGVALCTRAEYLTEQGAENFERMMYFTPGFLFIAGFLLFLVCSKRWFGRDPNPYLGYRL